MIATILLTHQNQYLKSDGTLPARPEHDKKLLRTICTGKVVSKAGYSMLPPSIRKVVTVGIPEVAITIPEINNADLLIISRSTEEFSGGKVFRLDNFSPIVKDTKLELWSKL